MEEMYRKICGRLRIIYYKIVLLLQSDSIVGKVSTEEIDVIIPVIKRDLKTLSQCIQGIKENVKHPISNIYIVAPKDPSIMMICRRAKLIFVDEKEILGYSANDLNIQMSYGVNISGWIFQQLLKLSGTIGQNRFFLVCDSDHILLRPHVFLMADYKTVFYQSSEYNPVYYANIKKMIGKYPFDPLSYISHKMIFDKEKLLLLKDEIEKRFCMKWDMAICENLDITKPSPFSEFEMYGNFVSDSNKKKRAWNNRDLSNSEIDTYSNLKKKYSQKYDTVTFPWKY